MYKKTSLQSLIINEDILTLDSKKINWLARIQNIWQLIEIAKWNELEWLENKKIINEDSVKLAKYILSQIVDILWYDPIEIKDRQIIPIVMKIWDSLIEKNTITNFVIWVYIQKIALKIKNIHLRYERLHKNKQNNELKDDSTKDHLTWLLNRRSMDLYLEDAIINKKRNWENYWIIIIDIDYFKSINDKYWHNTWDIVLEEISLSFREFFREVDKISRWWWEEFLIIMKWWNKDAYINKLNELRNEIENNLTSLVNKKIKSYWYKCENADWSCNDEIDKKLKITISIWITSIKNDDDIKTAVKRADQWLYLAKSSWRNKVIYYDI